MEGKVGVVLVGFILGVLLIQSSHALHEDQIGKFDWQQKLLGPIRFLFNDPYQPKRILVGTENNVIGAVHGNTGNILYRIMLEQSGTLLHYGPYEDRQNVAVSVQDKNLVKIRTFTAPTGVKVDEWVVQVEATHATSSGSKIFLITSLPNANNQITVTTFNLKTGAVVGGQKTYTIGPAVSGGFCTMTGPYFICGKGNALVLVNLEDGSLSGKKLEDGAVISEIQSSGSGPISAIILHGSGGLTKAFIILENAKSGPELFPLNLQSTSKRMTLSQFTSEERPLLYTSWLEDSHTVKMMAYNRNGEVVEGSSPVTVKASMPLSKLARTQGYIFNGRYGIAGVTGDELLFGTKTDGSPSQTLEVEWSREESLASIVSVEMVDYPSEVGPTWNPYQATSNIVKGFISRVRYEIEAIITGESLYASDEDRFGLRKVIVFVTKAGKVIGMDNSSGEILYSFLLPDFSLFSDSSAPLYIQRPAKYAPLKPQAAVIYRASSSGETLLFAFNPVEGKPMDEIRRFSPVLQTQMLHHAGEETQFVKQILLLDKQNNVKIYPGGGFEEVKNAYFFIAKKEDVPVLSGFAIQKVGNELKAKELWDLSLGRSDLLGVYGKLASERIHSQGRVLPDRSVSYKYMNPNLVVVVTAEHDVGNINLYLIDAVSGAMIHSFWHKKCRGPVHIVHSEHWIVYSLYNEKNRRYEINSVELYEGQAQSNSTTFSSFAVPPVEPIVVKQSYIFPTAIQRLAYTRTEKGITNKDILIALPAGGVLELPRIVVQPRLSQQHYTQQMQDEDGVIHHIPYQPELPILSEMIFNYNQSVRRIDGIHTWPTRLESTCLVLVHGSDLYYTKLTPSKTFDILKDDFDYWIITLALAGLSLAAYLAKRLAARRSLEQAWK